MVNHLSFRSMHFWMVKASREGAHRWIYQVANATSGKREEIPSVLKEMVVHLLLKKQLLDLKKDVDNFHYSSNFPF